MPPSSLETCWSPHGLSMARPGLRLWAVGSLGYLANPSVYEVFSSPDSIQL